MDEATIRSLLDQNPRNLLKRMRGTAERSEIVRKFWEISLDEKLARSVQKSAKKALYVFRSAGIDVEQFRPVAKEQKGKGEDEHTIDSCVLSIPDGVGSSELIVALMNPRSSSLVLYRFIINNPRGVLKYSQSPGSRKSLQKLVQQNDNFFLIPATYAVFRLHRALQKTEVGRVSGLGSLPGELRMVGEERVEHPVRKLVSARISRILTPDEERNLFTVGELGNMRLPEEDIRDFRSRINEAKSSKLVLQNRTPTQRVQEIVKGFYTTYFTSERLDDLCTRLLDLALVNYNRKGGVQARLLIEYADRLRSPKLVAEEHPLLNYLVYKALGQQ
jgi:hypothetical protein